MTWKQIERARETRMWIKDIIVPTVIVGICIASIPEVRYAISSKVKNVTDKIARFKEDHFKRK